MKTLKMLSFALAIMTVSGPLLAQTAPSAVSPRTTTAHPAHQPCWQQAGISQSALEKRRQVEESIHGQVESVCADSSLTPQQKQQKIHQLHQEARQQVSGLISPQQEQALQSCRAQRGEATHMGGMHGGGAGPCGEMASAPKQ
jgi:hypothetical protein